MTDTIRLSVDRTKCIGSRMCVLEAPDVFTMNDAEGWSETPDEPVERTDAVWEAVEFCPREAIVATDAASGAQLFP